MVFGSAVFLFLFLPFTLIIHCLLGPAPLRHLPIGISFYTFHILSYLIDVYRRDAVPQKNPLGLGLYIFLFPQLQNFSYDYMKTLHPDIVPESRVEPCNR